MSFNIMYAGNEIDRLLNNDGDLLVDLLLYFNLPAKRKKDFVYVTCPVCGDENTNFRVANFRREGAQMWWTCWKSTTIEKVPHHRKYFNNVFGFIRGHTQMDPETLYVEILKAIRHINKEGGTPNYQTQVLHSLEREILRLEKAPESEWRAFCRKIADKVEYRNKMQKKGYNVA